MEVETTLSTVRVGVEPPHLGYDVPAGMEQQTVIVNEWPLCRYLRVQVRGHSRTIRLDSTTAKEDHDRD
jgi:hypothetical protein